mgnify:CR=1 FL=1
MQTLLGPRFPFRHNGGIIGQYGVIEQVTVELVAQVQTVDGNGLVINIDILYRHLVLG